MNKANHTPSPWIISPEDDFIIVPLNEKGIICEVHIAQDNWQANANLIAMAPELYNGVLQSLGVLAVIDPGNPLVLMLDNLLKKIKLCQ